MKSFRFPPRLTAQEIMERQRLSLKPMDQENNPERIPDISELCKPSEHYKAVFLMMFTEVRKVEENSNKERSRDMRESWRKVQTETTELKNTVWPGFIPSSKIKCFKYLKRYSSRTKNTDGIFTGSKAEWKNLKIESVS